MAASKAGATPAQKELKTIPGFSQGVRENSQVRTIKMNSPICPKSKITMERGPDGNLRAKAQSAESQNCQLEGGEWWIACQERGHNPYFRVQEWTTIEPEYVEQEDGTLLLTGEKKFLHRELLPNIVQVPVNVRINQGIGARLSMENKGRRRLTEAGYAEVCQYRNCQKPVDAKYEKTRIGSYCSLYHLQLIAADERGEFLQQVAKVSVGPNSRRARQRRERQLREAAADVFA